MTTTYDSIATTTLGSDTKSVTFSSIAGTFTDLVLIVNGKTSTNDDFINLTVNSDSGSNYSMTTLYGTGSAAGSARYTSTTRIYVGYFAALNTTNQWNGILHFMNYANTTTNKTVLFRDNSPSGTSYPGTAASVGLWRSTSAINTIKLEANSGNLGSGTTFSLFGIKAE